MNRELDFYLLSHSIIHLKGVLQRQICFTKVNAKFGELLVKVHIFKDSSPSDHNFPIVSEIVHSV